MTADGTICRIKEPTVWAHSLVTVEREGGRLRLCIDPKELKKKIKGKHFHMLTRNNMCAEMEGTKFSSILVAFCQGFGRFPWTQKTANFAFSIHCLADAAS